MENPDLREALAALAHEQWSGWWLYAFSKGAVNDDGTLTLPAWAVTRWTRQMKTPYHELPEDEKESDRTEADRVLRAIQQTYFYDATGEQRQL